MHLQVSYKTGFGNYHTVDKKFETREHFDRWFKEMVAKDNKIIGHVFGVMSINNWNWEDFFSIDPEYISEGSWDNAEYMAKKEWNEYIDFVVLVECKNFSLAKDFYFKIIKPKL